MKKKLGLKVLGLVVFSLLLAVNCAEDGDAPNANLLPDTYITNYQIEIDADSATSYNTIIYWNGSDQDGAVYWYEWKIENANGEDIVSYEENDDGTIDTLYYSVDWQPTNLPNLEIKLAFPTLDTKYVFSVRAEDNLGGYDDTPAVDTISIDRTRDFNNSPNTEITEGPSNGATTTTGIHFVITGTDIDGAVDTVEYKVDDAAEWTKVATDAYTGIATIDVTGLEVGARTITFRGIDNFREPDPTPISVSVIADSTLRPYLTVSSGPIPGAYYYLPAGSTTLDLAATWSGDAGFYYSTLEYRYAVDDTADWSDWTTDVTATLSALTAVSHVFYVQAVDLGGGATTFSTNFAVGEFVGDLGILVVNGIDYANYGGGPYETFWNGINGFGHNFDFWDCFTSGQGGYTDVPVLDTTYIGSGIVPGGTLSHYSSMVMIMNGYNGDLEVFESMLPLIMSYLNAGGNIYLGTRYGSQFIYDDLQAYCHIDTLENSEWDNINVTLDATITAVAEGLVDMPAIGSLSYTDIPKLPTNAIVTTLFTSASYPADAAGIYVNPASTGKFVFVAGRPYRYDAESYGANVDYILTNYFGEE